jgi:glutamate synthase domain-containing protein 3
MSDDMRTKLTDFAAEFMAEVQAEQKLKEVFEKHLKLLEYPQKQEIMNNWLNLISELAPLQHF